MRQIELSKNTDPKNQKASWDLFWEKKNKSLLKRIFFWVRQRFVTTRLADFLEEISSGNSILEAGCGSGEATILFAKKSGSQVCLVDYSDQALELAAVVAAFHGVHVRLVKADILNLSNIVGENAADVVWNCGVVEHFAELSAVLAEMDKCARKKSVIVVPEKSFFWIFFIAFNRALGLVEKDFFIRLYSLNELKVVIEKSGFQVKEGKRLRILGLIPYIAVGFKSKK